MPARPLGITLLAWLFFVNSAFYALLAALMVVRPTALATILHALSPGGTGPETTHTAMGAWLPIYYVTGAGLCATVAAGLWRLRNWARLVVLALTVLAAITIPMAVIALMRSPNAGAAVLTLLRICLSAALIWYLLGATVRAAFRPRVPGNA